MNRLAIGPERLTRASAPPSADLTTPALRPPPAPSCAAPKAASRKGRINQASSSTSRARTVMIRPPRTRRVYRHAFGTPPEAQAAKAIAAPSTAPTSRPAAAQNAALTAGVAKRVPLFSANLSQAAPSRANPSSAEPSSPAPSAVKLSALDSSATLLANSLLATRLGAAICWAAFLGAELLGAAPLRAARLCVASLGPASLGTADIGAAGLRGLGPTIRPASRAAAKGAAAIKVVRPNRADRFDTAAQDQTAQRAAAGTSRLRILR